MLINLKSRVPGTSKQIRSPRGTYNLIIYKKLHCLVATNDPVSCISEGAWGRMIEIPSRNQLFYTVKADAGIPCI